MSTAPQSSGFDARHRVVITGMGIVSSLGNTLDGVSDRLRRQEGGIVGMDGWRERGLASQVAALASIAGQPAFARRFERFMGDTARFACHAARQAIDDAGLTENALHSPRVGVVIGSGMGALSSYDAAMEVVATRGVERTSPYVVPQCMSSTTAANVAQVFGIEGVAYSPSSACVTSALAIGQAMQLIRSGAQDLVLAGGSEELHDNTALLFDAMGALSRHANADPARASCPYDAQRSGFVLGSGAGVLVLESFTHARARGAQIYGELTGFSQATGAGNMVGPGRGTIARVIQAVLGEAGIDRPDYVNTHAPSTPLGDLEEFEALRKVFGAEHLPLFSSIKGLTGHAPGACGVHEVIGALLMMRDGFVTGSPVNLVEPCFSGAPLVREPRDAMLEHVMSISFGFGGGCASLLMSKTN